MHCAEFENRFQDLLDARVAPESDRLLQEHCLQCSACREMLRAQQALFAGLDAFDPPPPSRNFADQVVLRAAAPRRIKRWPYVAVAALAASILLAVAVISGGPRGRLEAGRNSPQAHQRQTRSPGGLSVAIGTIPPAKPESPRDDDLDVQTSPDEYRELLHNFFVELPYTTDRLPGVDHLAGGLKPIASSFSAAFDTLRRTIPGAKSSSRSDKPQAGMNFAPWPQFSA